jgi:ubiquitin carboxyl-terminal hydrolase 8
MPIPIHNYNNTCYINSILQPLLATSSLIKYLAEDEFSNYLNIMKKKLDHEEIIRTVVYNIYKLVKKIYIDDEKETIKNNVINLRILFGNYLGQDGQQDSQEFLNFVLDKIHEETKCSVTIEYKNVSDNVVEYNKMIQNLSPEEIKKLRNSHLEEDTILTFFAYWQNFLNKNYSTIINIFGGTYISEIKCLTCNSITVKYEYMTTLPLAIVDDNITNLPDLLNNFCKVEILRDGDMYECDTCKIKTIAAKRTKFWNPPDKLIILLKKYSNNLEKNNVEIKYPLKLDIESCVAELKQKYWKVNTNYELYAVTKHIGTTDFGHYYAYTKCILDDLWYKCDDDTITKVSEDDVLNCNGYILWYKNS